MARCGDTAAELLGHRLHAVADAEYGNTELEHRLRRDGRRHVGDRFRPARQDDALGTEGANVLVADVPGKNLAVHAAFTYAPRDELGVLRAEIENQNPVRMDIGGMQGRGIGGRLCVHVNSL